MSVKVHNASCLVERRIIYLQYIYIVFFPVYIYIRTFFLIVDKMKLQPAAKDLWALRPGCFSRICFCSLHLAFHQLSHGGGGGAHAGCTCSRMANG